MDTFLDLRTGVQLGLTIGTESVLLNTDAQNAAINSAYRKIAGLYRWKKLQDAKETTTQLNINYYDYPQGWRDNSIWKLEVNGEDYGDPIAFSDFLYETDNNIPSGLRYLWANHGDQYFFYPTPTAAGLNISVWGIKNVETLSDNTDTTIFSYSMPEVNEAIVLEAREILKAKADPKNTDALLSPAAMQIVTNTWSRVKQEASKIEKTRAMFGHTDYFATKTRISDADMRGRF